MTYSWFIFNPEHLPIYLLSRLARKHGRCWKDLRVILRCRQASWELCMSHILCESNAVKKDISHLGGGKSQRTVSCVDNEGKKLVASAYDRVGWDRVRNWMAVRIWISGVFSILNDLLATGNVKCVCCRVEGVRKKEKEAVGKSGDKARVWPEAPWGQPSQQES